MALSTALFRHSDVSRALQQDLQLLRTLRDDHGSSLLALLCLDHLVPHSLICDLAPALAASDAASACDATGSSALHVAVRHRPAAVAAAVARCSSAAVRDARDMHSRTALHLAVLANAPDHVQQLLEAGCDANVMSTGVGGGSALHWAASAGFADIVRLLLPRCDPLLLNEAGVTAAALAKNDICRDLILDAERESKQRNEAATSDAGSVRVARSAAQPVTSGVKKKLTIKVNPK
jgi:ankyrin repeat protein